MGSQDVKTVTHPFDICAEAAHSRIAKYFHVMVMIWICYFSAMTGLLIRRRTNTCAHPINCQLRWLNCPKLARVRKLKQPAVCRAQVGNAPIMVIENAFSACRRGLGVAEFAEY